jgi:hypothetical protein
MKRSGAVCLGQLPTACAGHIQNLQNEHKTERPPARPLRAVVGRISLVLIGAFLVSALLVDPVQAVGTRGGDAAHIGAVLGVLNSRPNLLAYVETRWPDLYVRICYGGHAWPGYFDVDKSRRGKAFTDQVAHEFAHMIQLKNRDLEQAWLAELTERGYGPDTWVWGEWAPLCGLRDPWEAFAENVKRAYFSPYYTKTTTPNTQLAWLSRADMTAFLKANGVEP